MGELSSPPGRDLDRLREAALTLVDTLDLGTYYLFHVIRADLMRWNQQP